MENDKEFQELKAAYEACLNWSATAVLEDMFTPRPFLTNPSTYETKGEPL